MEATNVKFCTKTLKDGVLTVAINRKVAVQRKLADYPEQVREQAMSSIMSGGRDRALEVLQR